MVTFPDRECSANVAENVAELFPVQCAKITRRYIVTFSTEEIILETSDSPKAFLHTKIANGQKKCSDVAVSLSPSVNGENAATLKCSGLGSKCSGLLTLGFIRKRNVTPLVCWGFILLGGGMNEPV